MDGSVEAVFTRLKGFIEELLGADVAGLVGVEMGSSFATDLEMDSIQTVAFAGRVTEVYGERADLYLWLSKLPMRRLKNLTVGEVATFIAKGHDGYA